MNRGTASDSKTAASHVAASLEGKVVAVTGAARGMGMAHVHACIELGAQVLVLDVRDELGVEVADRYEDRALYVHTDVTDERDWARSVAAGLSAFGRIDGLVNNAGILVAKTLLDTSVEEYERVVAVNQRSVFLGMKAFVRPMLESGGGSIVNISSTAGLVGIAECFAYSASKFAVRGMSKAAAIELAPFGVRVNSVHPGDTLTPMIQELGDTDAVPDTSMIPLQRYANPYEISSAVCFLLSDSSSYMTGAELVLDGGYTAS
ncbi:glucose 1-dehydrogenase [Streptomyces sp. NPDC051322]|uniref:glucose 1-dehydrogenase n=1 Tax=Streptomyces sp. NPDC051322 TaxID=3154645 RepID=UPI003450201D